MKEVKYDNLVDFAVEVLHGCSHHCYGCNVNREDQEGYIGQDLTKLHGLFDDLLKHGYILANFSIGPTDFFTSTNTEQVLQQSMSLMDQFKAITLQSTFLYPKKELERQAALIAPYVKGRRIKLGFPVDPRHLGKEKYARTVVENVLYFKSLLPETTVIKIFAILNVKQYDEVEEDPIFRVADMVRYFRSHRIDFDAVLTEGRLDMTDLNNQEKLKKSFLYVKRIHDEDAIPRGIYELLTLSTYYREAVHLHSIDSQGRAFRDIDFVYKNGKIYNTVFSGEAVTLFHDSLAMDNTQEWNTLAIHALRERILLSQLDYMEKTKECNGCEFASSCMERGFLQVMKIVRTKDCIVSKQTFERNRNTLESTLCKEDYRKMEFPVRHEKDNSNSTSQNTIVVEGGQSPNGVDCKANGTMQL